MDDVFKNKAFNELFGNIFGIDYIKDQENKLNEYWANKDISGYYHLLNSIKSSGAKVYRSNITGKHIIKGY